MDDAEVRHFRMQVEDVLDGYCAGRTTVMMVIPAFMCMLPIARDEAANAYRTKLTMILQDLSENLAERKAAEDLLVNMIVEERDQRDILPEILNAIEALKAQGVEISVEPGVNHFYLDDEGPYLFKDMMEQASKRCEFFAKHRPLK